MKLIRIYSAFVFLFIAFFLQSGGAFAQSTCSAKQKFGNSHGLTLDETAGHILIMRHADAPRNNSTCRLDDALCARIPSNCKMPNRRINNAGIVKSGNIGRFLKSLVAQETGERRVKRVEASPACRTQDTAMVLSNELGYSYSSSAQLFEKTNENEARTYVQDLELDAKEVIVLVTHSNIVFDLRSWLDVEDAPEISRPADLVDAEGFIVKRKNGEFKCVAWLEP